MSRDQDVCPKCGSLNTSAKVRQGKVLTTLGLVQVADVGWRCEDCGATWGFDVFKEDEPK